MAQRERLRAATQFQRSGAFALSAFVERQVERPADRLGGAHGGQCTAGATAHRGDGGIEGGAVAWRHYAVAHAGPSAGVRQCAGTIDRLLAQVGRDLVDQSELQRLVGGMVAAGGDHVERRHRAGQARQPLGAAGAGDQPDARLWQPDPAVRCHQARVAGECNLEAAAERGAVQRRDHGFRRGIERCADVGGGDLAGGCVEIAKIGAGDEGFAGAGQHGGT